MSNINLFFKIESYSDDSDIVVPVLKEFDWTRNLQAITSSKVDVITRACANGTTTIQLPAASVSLMYLETDNTISIRLNGDTGSTNVVSPSASGEMDGVYFKRGSITSLVIYNGSATNTANVKIFLGV